MNTPKVFRNTSEVCKYPVFVKPDMGEGSRGARAIYTKEELEVALLQDPSLIILELLKNQ